MGHSKHKLSTKKNMLYCPKKVVTWHPYLQITATSLQQLLSSVPKVVACEQQTYFRSQGSLRTADVFLRLLFAGYPGGRCGLGRFHVVVCLFLVGFLLSSMPGGLVVFALRVRLAAKWFKWVFLFMYLFFIYSFDKKKSYYSAWKCIFLFGKWIRIIRFIFEMTLELMKLVLLQKGKKCMLMGLLLENFFLVVWMSKLGSFFRFCWFVCLCFRLLFFLFIFQILEAK